MSQPNDTITLEQLANHNKLKSLWIAVHGQGKSPSPSTHPSSTLSKKPRNNTNQHSLPSLRLHNLQRRPPGRHRSPHRQRRHRRHRIIRIRRPQCLQHRQNATISSRHPGRKSCTHFSNLSRCLSRGKHAHQDRDIPFAALAIFSLDEAGSHYMRGFSHHCGSVVSAKRPVGGVYVVDDAGKPLPPIQNRDFGPGPSTCVLGRCGTRLVH